MGPPNVLLCPKPMSSISTTTTLGAVAGAFTSNRGGAFALRASSSVIGGFCGSAIGRTVRSSARVACCADTGAMQEVVSNPTTRKPLRRLILIPPLSVPAGPFVAGLATLRLRGKHGPWHREDRLPRDPRVPGSPEPGDRVDRARV